jgi:hypothetical protein
MNHKRLSIIQSLPLSINTADNADWPKMWNGTGMVAAERFATGRTCSHVTVTIGGRDDADWGVRTATPDCTTVLSVYNDGPLCHSHNRKAPVDEMNGATV